MFLAAFEMGRVSAFFLEVASFWVKRRLIRPSFRRAKHVQDERYLICLREHQGFRFLPLM
jgi:hypothetical protein